MIITTDLKKHLEHEITNASCVWIASAMISLNGWRFLQRNIPESAFQFFLIGIDLSTAPSVFEEILSKPEIGARVYEADYTYHPKVYIIKKGNGELAAFIGSSNTTSWGLEKNVEMNYQIHDQNECKKLIKWFNSLYANGYLVTPDFVSNYKTKYAKYSIRAKANEEAGNAMKMDITKDKGQFFSSNQHAVFAEKFHYIQNKELLEIRRNVKNRFIELHEAIFPQFSKYGITDLHCHHQSRERVSRHYFNQFSGNYVNAIWLHYGKSKSHLVKYPKEKDQSFINHARIQVIIHEDNIGIWLVLGKDWGSQIDRDYFRKEMLKSSVRKQFYNILINLDDTYWIDYKGYSLRAWIKDIKSIKDLHNITLKENIKNYFIIGCNIDWLDSRLSVKNISTTVLEELRNLYPLYEIMRHK